MSDGDAGAKFAQRGRQTGSVDARQALRVFGATRRERFAALDLGTNNCRLLIAAPKGRGVRIIDAFSQIVRLGEGLSATGNLSDPAMGRTLDALKICAEKMTRRGVTRWRCITTQACRVASNGEEFLQRVGQETGLSFDVISTEEEARLAVLGCADLFDPEATAGLVFDIGGGSTELSWIKHTDGAATDKAEIVAWRSMPIGVVTLSEKWGGRELDAQTYDAIIDDVRRAIAAFGDPGGQRGHFKNNAAHLLGTSGTVTSIAGVHLGLDRYRRDRVDGFWLSVDDARATSMKLRQMSFDERAANACIGHERADLVVCGCAILEAILREWPTTRIRVADRGLREGILQDLAHKAKNDRRRRRRRRRKKKSTED
ncbi:MAG: Ppx/GppA phosphatase family protein [Pseudomonadota bacterium]